MPAPTLKSPIQQYLTVRDALHAVDARTEGGIRRAFGALLVAAARIRRETWTLVEEETMKTPQGHQIRWDGVLKDNVKLLRGFWEAKDADDDLTAEIALKQQRGYSLENSIFENTRTAILFQNGRETLRADLTRPDEIAALLETFYAYEAPIIVEFEAAMDKFADALPALSADLNRRIAEGHARNARFQAAYADFMALCHTSLDPTMTAATLDDMLVQHLLTERLIRRIFDNSDFRTKNVIAGEIEKVIDALVSATFSREDYLRSLDRYYVAIEHAAGTIPDFSQKQAFLNGVYERFFQGYSTAVADTHGIVYTPQPIVDFMCASVIDALHTEFGKTLGDPDVMVLDPATGTGNFIVNLLRRAKGEHRAGLYQGRLFANEVMLLPYYIAALNIEHAYYDLTGTYAPFEGLCFVDTLGLAEPEQMTMFVEKNTVRVEAQRKAPITIIIGNPPYNVGQRNENDNNQNRKYPVIDRRVKATYSKDSAASSKSKVSDAYVKFFRFAADRLADRDGIVCYVTNNGFVDQNSFDGFRKHIVQDYTHVWHLDLGGNSRTGQGGNVFDIRVGVGITLAIKRAAHAERLLHYFRVPEDWTKQDKLGWLAERRATAGVDWMPITPDARHTWLIPANAAAFASMLSLGSKAAKSKKNRQTAETTIFQTYSLGVSTNRDDVVYDFDPKQLIPRVEQFIDDYNGEVDRHKRANRPADVNNFVRYEKIKWSRDLKKDFVRGKYANYAPHKVRTSLYRPFTKKHLFFDRILNEEVYQQHTFFPTPAQEAENRVLIVAGVGNRKGFGCFITNLIPSLDFAFEKAQCFPFYTYDEDGTNRRENISDAALAAFQAAHGAAVGKWDVFYYTYAALHHPAWRVRFADSLKKDLPRIPVMPDGGDTKTFHRWAAAGRQLAGLHLDYETVQPYPLVRVEQPGVRFSYRVDRMRFDRARTTLTVNESFSLTDFPPAAFEYKLGGRSAVEWVVDQYRVTCDQAGQITSDPNRLDAPSHIVDLVGRVVAVSVGTMAIVDGL